MDEEFPVINSNRVVFLKNRIWVVFNTMEYHMLVINHDQEKDWIFVVNEKEKMKKKSQPYQGYEILCVLNTIQKDTF